MLHAKKLRADHHLAASEHRAVLKSTVQVLSVIFFKCCYLCQKRSKVRWRACRFGTWWGLVVAVSAGLT